ncbi:hypothetical protein ETAA8_25230 [Anatilimnocola aggregata]|uniref:Uncharacterized protein n=1 Tax=Anatilimnocola aggregata TaxID=2528021 RepID=A0A517YB11_9BACT|nr:hypothetical protein ETAA8_25230 [Anatilimnocola aggregata]
MPADGAFCRLLNQRSRCWSPAFLSAGLLLLSILATCPTAKSAESIQQETSCSRQSATVSTIRLFDCSVEAEERHSDQLPADEFRTVYPDAPTELNSSSTLRVESDWTEVIYWQPAALPSPRLIPNGLVLSYLCDSARHQCSGVQLI